MANWEVSVKEEARSGPSEGVSDRGRSGGVSAEVRAEVTRLSSRVAELEADQNVLTTG